MIEAVIGIAGWIGLAGGRKLLERKAFGHLLSRGVVASGVKHGRAGVSGLMSKIGEKGFDAGSTMRLLRGHKALREGFPGLAPTGRLSSQAFETGSQALRESAHYLRAARATGAAEKIFMGVPLIGTGFSMFSGMDSLAEKNIAPPAQEIAQTQQMFMPRQAYTQRQRAIQAIHQSQITTRSALGNEAQYMHG